MLATREKRRVSVVDVPHRPVHLGAVPLEVRSFPLGADTLVVSQPHRLPPNKRQEVEEADPRLPIEQRYRLESLGEFPLGADQLRLSEEVVVEHRLRDAPLLDTRIAEARVPLPRFALGHVHANITAPDRVRGHRGYPRLTEDAQIQQVVLRGEYPLALDDVAALQTRVRQRERNSRRIRQERLFVVRRHHHPAHAEREAFVDNVTLHHGMAPPVDIEELVDENGGRIQISKPGILPAELQKVVHRHSRREIRSTGMSCAERPPQRRGIKRRAPLEHHALQLVPHHFGDAVQHDDDVVRRHLVVEVHRFQVRAHHSHVQKTEIAVERHDGGRVRRDGTLIVGNGKPEVPQPGRGVLDHVVEVVPAPHLLPLLIPHGLPRVYVRDDDVPDKARPAGIRGRDAYRQHNHRQNEAQHGTPTNL